MFPGAGAQVYYNEAGEPLGWDYPPSEPEWFDCCGVYGRCVCDEYDRDEDEDEDEDVESTNVYGSPMVIGGLG